MKRNHFETLRPICPLCSSQRNESHPLKLALVIHERNDAIGEGILHCSNPSCQCEYPIIDGIPILAPDVRTFIANNIQLITSRSDLSHETESLLGDCAGPGSALENSRHHLSIYNWSHYGEFDSENGPSSVMDLFEQAWQHVDQSSAGPLLDVACSVGRTTFEMGKRSSHELVLGVDLDFRMLQTAQRVLRDGIVRYGQRKSGLVYEQRQFATPFADTANVDFWLCDATQLPFINESFMTVAGLNVLDCVASPIQFLHQVDRIVRSGGWFMLSSPYDWSAAASAPDSWIGGHSQRGPDGGSSEVLLSKLMTPGRHPQSVRRLQIEKTIEQIPWRLRLHDRFTAEYVVQMILAKASK